MPVDPKNPYCSSRRTYKTLISDEDIELKRSRANTLRFMHSPGVLQYMSKRHLHAWSNRKAEEKSLGLRSSPPDTQEHQNRKISEMSQRIRQLEDALAILQSNISSEPHPLLVEQLLSVRSDPDRSSVQDKEDHEETSKSFGTLIIGDGGQHRYFGASAGEETLLLADPTLPTEEFEPNISLGGAPDLLNNLASMSFMSGCAIGSETFESAMAMLFAGLPPRLRAWSLCETYLEHFACHMQLVTRQDLIEDILTPIYNAKKEREDPACEPCAQISPHKFALLYLVFARGVLGDLTLPAYHADGETYHHYACAAMALRSFIDSPTVETVQVIVLMANYRSCAGERYTRDSVWALGSLGCKLAQSIGLHRDPGRWHMDEKTVELRRRIFWEVYAADLHHSLALGRPPSIELSYVDCAFPTCDEEDYDAKYWNWKYEVTRDVIGSAAKVMLAAAPPSYKAILELDRNIRETVLPPVLNVFLRVEDAQTHVIVGSIAAKAPSSVMASTALMELSLTVDLYERGAGVLERAQTGLAILQKLKEKASLVQGQYHSSTSSDAPSPTSSILNSQEDGMDELALFGGQTRVLISKTLASKTSSLHITSNSNSMEASPALSSCASPAPSPWLDLGSLLDIHPSLVEYASLLPLPTLSTNFTGDPAPNFESQSLDQVTAGVNGFIPVAWNTEIPSHPQTEMPPAVSDTFTNGTNAYKLFQELPETTLDIWGSNDMTNLGQMMSIDSDMDEHWMAFMKDSGLVNPTTFGV
ncbi:hypothetical protein FIBSPDRAFT_892245 [Athelia psychrophila]|uniref:Xylanolytic transcriptional activator regulatory domain-containing protein n=1 Tax=Athelia psychrophila TaxID=1759441 RepID=A0A166IQR7_9AGAM|nr:hypothetical protein FIBSPDRAFT_892245 [Fibularhizoctonia sp. CBS 109695]